MAHKRSAEHYQGLWRSEAHNHHRLQSVKRKQWRKDHPGRLNYFRALISENIIGWLHQYFKSRFDGKHKFLDYTGKASNGVFTMIKGDRGNIKIAVASDWATDTTESEKIRNRIAEENPDYTIHMGDVYFVGEPEEVVENFVSGESIWHKGTSGSLAIPGNHEFYSSGSGYYEKLLPATFVDSGTSKIQQEASFFCLENDYWQILALDTGYHSVGLPVIEFICHPDARLHKLLLKWLKETIKLNADDKRGLIILTHHQYTSAFDEYFPKAAEQLKEFIGTEREVIWLWGHEHRFAVYGKYQSTDGIKAYGRCIGHGGMPVELNPKNRSPHADKAQRFNLVFYDKRETGKVIKGIPVGHNGYAVMRLENDKLTIEYKDEKNLLFTEIWKIDLSSGKLSGTAFVSPEFENELTLYSQVYSDAVK